MISDNDYCPRCDGSGEGMYDGSTCSLCKGSGHVRDHNEQDDIAQGWAERKAELEHDDY
jgi:DnaJ-class molecular chaperone